MRVPAPLAAGVGVALLVGVILFAAVTRAAFDVRLLMLAAAGAALQVAAPFLDRGSPPGPRATWPAPRPTRP